MSATQIDVTTLDIISCARCGLRFGVPADFIQRRRDDHESFVCPSGHNNHYPHQSEAERLREQLAAKDREIAAQRSRVESERTWRQNAEAETRAVTRRLRATKAVVTRTKKKIVAGRCPCCSHQFKDLRHHMAKEHPRYDPERAATALEAKV